MCTGDRSARAGVGGFARNFALVEEGDDVDVDQAVEDDHVAEARGSVQAGQLAQQLAARVVRRHAEADNRRAQQAHAHLQIRARAAAG